MYSFTVIGSALLAILPFTFGHSNIVDPPATWHQPWPTNSFSATTSGEPFGPINNNLYGWGGDGNIKYFVANKDKYSSLRDFIMKNQKVEAGADPQCGLTIKDDSQRAVLPSVVKFSNFGHPGPCELWCDNVKLAYNENCHAAYPDASIPIDTSKCAGADRLTWYWLAVHAAPWQVYIDCVYLKGGSTKGGNVNQTPTVAPTPVTPAPYTKVTVPSPPPKKKCSKKL